MPEHVNGLIWPAQQEYDIGKILESIKLPVTKRAVAFVKRTLCISGSHGKLSAERKSALSILATW